MVNVAFVNTLAAQIRRADPTSTRSESMKAAYEILSTYGDCKLLVFIKKGETKPTRRIVSERWYDYQPPVGGGRSTSTSLKLFADLGKWICGENCIISAYPERILNLQSVFPMA